MSALETFRSNLNVARTLMFDGRDRYLEVTKTAIAIEQLYRKQRRRAKLLPAQAAADLLSEAHSESAQYICDLCKKNGAVWVKFAQIMSCRPDILPMEYLASLQQLQDDAKPAPFEKIHPLIVKTWGQDWDRQFRTFNVVPAAAASIAQVHRATLKDGSEVAVKLQLPDARVLFEQDTVVFNSLANIAAPLVKEVDLKQVANQLIKLTLEELDFSREGKNLQEFASHEHLPGIVIPQIYESLSSNEVLVTSWIEGVKLTDYLQQNPDRAKPVLTKLLHSYVQQITQFGIYHADPHPGNFIITENEQIAILDYGAIGTLTEEEVKNYGQLLIGLSGTRADNLGQLFSNAGFVCDRQEVIEQISDAFVEDDLDDLSVSELLAYTMGRLRKNRIAMPDSFIAMVRVLISIGGLMTHYDVDFEWPF
jgi:ubiquinone biosynthesis protein